MPEKSVTERVIIFLYNYPGASIKDVAQGLGISPNLARAILYRLKSRGIVDKSGYGYVLTSVGESVAEKIIGKQAEKPLEKKVVEKPQVEKKETRPIIEETVEKVGPGRTSDLGDLEERIRVLEEKIAGLDNLLSSLKRELRDLKKALEEARKSRRDRRRVKVERLPKPIMSIMDARNTLGDGLHSLIYSGRAVVVGSLVVDSEYYNEFLARFPISRRDAEKLSDQEKLLLEELKNEGKIYLYAGKEYRLV